MKIRFCLLLALLLTPAACVDGGPQPAGAAYVEIVNGGSFSGGMVLRIYADDRLETIESGPFGQKGQRSETQGLPGSYRKVLQLALAEGPKVQRRLAVGGEHCMDYGTDAVRVVPEVGGFKGVSAGCPEAVMHDFQARLRAALSGG